MATDAPQSGPVTPAGQLDLKSAPMPEVETELGYSPGGLSQAEAVARLERYGPNEIGEHKTNPLLKFLSYFWGPIPWMIEIAVILSGPPPPSRPTPTTKSTRPEQNSNTPVETRRREPLRSRSGPARVDRGRCTHSFGSGVAGCFLSELHARGEAELRVDVGEVGLHGAR